MVTREPTVCIRCGNPTYAMCLECYENCCGNCLARHHDEKHAETEPAPVRTPPTTLPGMYRNPREALGLPPLEATNDHPLQKARAPRDVPARASALVITDVGRFVADGPPPPAPTARTVTAGETPNEEPPVAAIGAHVHRYVISYWGSLQVGHCDCGSRREYPNPNQPRTTQGARQ